MGMRKMIKIFTESMKIGIADRIVRVRKTINMERTSLPLKQYSEESRKDNEEVKQFCLYSINKLVFPS